MDAVILAAGRNDRLKSLVPAYMKPLIMVNGVPIIVTIIRDLVFTNVAGTITVVVSPQNVAPIVDVVEAGDFPKGLIRYVVQPDALGPMDAVRRAMPMTHHDVMIVCADNIIPAATYKQVEAGLVDCDTSLAVKLMPLKEAERFTYFDEKDGDVYEKLPPPEHVKDPVYVWLGPLAFRKGFLFTHAADTERLSGLIALADTVNSVEANCVDIGVPEELP